MSALSPCASCRRFVRVEDPDCPFCGSTEARPAPRVPRRTKQRLSRAAMVLAGAVVISGCDDAEPTQDIYGGPPVDEPEPELPEPEPETETETALPVEPMVEVEPDRPIYGGPPDPPPVPTDEDRPPAEATMDLAVPAYGGPPPVEP